MGKPGLVPSASVGRRFGGLGAVRGVGPLGCVLGDVQFACGETGSVIMSLGCAVDVI